MKPVVIYTDAARPPVLGKPAHVQVFDHPNFPRWTWIWTTAVQKIDGSNFLTLNTLYTPGMIEDPLVRKAHATA